MTPREQIKWLADRAGLQDGPSRLAWEQATEEAIADAERDARAAERAAWARAIEEADRTISTAIRALAAVPAASQEPDRATIARVVAVLLDEQRKIVALAQSRNVRNLSAEDRIAWLSETLAHYAGGGT